MARRNRGVALVLGGDLAGEQFFEKVALQQLTRGSRDFATRTDYEKFLGEIFAVWNRRRVVKLADELRPMHELPAVCLEEFRRDRARVSCNPTVLVVAGNHYSVSSQMIGAWVDVRVYADRIEVWHSERRVAAMDRLRGKGQMRLPADHLVADPKAGRVRGLSVPGGALPDCGIP